ncbi:MAG: transposase [Chitinophagaceae bacterium]|nr:transposase [Oligoflexus sp.]
MGRHANYSREFKEAIVSKIVNRGNQTVAQVCEAEGIGKAKAANWLKSVNMPGMSKKKKKWSPKEKLKAISETMSASEAEMGAYLRKEGLHSHQLQEWQEQALTSLGSQVKTPDERDERDELIANLEREILRKDKALAEASALLILQKKVQLIWDLRDQRLTPPPGRKS